MEHILTGPYNKPTNNSRRPPRGRLRKKRRRRRFSPRRDIRGRSVF
ncbi:MAG: hypothetical protein ACMX3H_00225 [Sodalis sp. (in: enterobacteria)]